MLGDERGAARVILFRALVGDEHRNAELDHVFRSGIESKRRNCGAFGQISRHSAPRESYDSGGHRNRDANSGRHVATSLVVASRSSKSKDPRLYQ